MRGGERLDGGRGEAGALDRGWVLAGVGVAGLGGLLLAVAHLVGDVGASGLRGCVGVGVLEGLAQAFAGVSGVDGRGLLAFCEALSAGGKVVYAVLELADERDRVLGELMHRQLGGVDGQLVQREQQHGALGGDAEGGVNLQATELSKRAEVNFAATQAGVACVMHSPSFQPSSGLGASVERLPGDGHLKAVAAGVAPPGLATRLRRAATAARLAAARGLPSGGRAVASVDTLELSPPKRGTRTGLVVLLEHTIVHGAGATEPTPAVYTARLAHTLNGWRVASFTPVVTRR